MTTIDNIPDFTDAKKHNRFRIAKNTGALFTYEACSEKSNDF